MRWWSDLISGTTRVFVGVGKALSEAFKWSNLGAVGRSHLGRLTILAPFVGYLIVFNPSLVAFFHSSLPKMDMSVPPWLLHLHSLRLSFLYFGLLSLGAGIGLFTVFAPEQIRSYRTVSEYIADMEAVFSVPLVKDKFENLILRFLRLHDKATSHPVFGQSKLSFPFIAESYLHQLVAALFQELPEGLVETDNWNDDIEGTMVMASPYFFVGAAGHILTDNIMRVTLSGRLVDRNFREEMSTAAVSRRKEVFFLDYLSANYSAFVLRFFVAMFIFIGFAFLLLPTITTSILAAAATFK